MRALVVYESLWGNTEQVAQRIGLGLRDLATVTVVEVSEAPVEPADDVGLVVAGGPTHAFSMSRASTRAEAVERGALRVRPGIGLREWLDGLSHGEHRTRLATFDTRVRKVRHLPGSAARSAAKVARRHGYSILGPAMSFYVEDVDGPLLAGELDRAQAWGRTLGEALTDPA